MKFSMRGQEKCDAGDCLIEVTAWGRFNCIWFSNLFTMSVPYECYFRPASTVDLKHIVFLHIPGSKNHTN
jgi:hypothetical protein